MIPTNLIIHMGTKVNYISWNHVFREINSITDNLTEYGLLLSLLSLNSSVILFKFPLRFISFP